MAGFHNPFQWENLIKLSGAPNTKDDNYIDFC